MICGRPFWVVLVIFSSCCTIGFERPRTKVFGRVAPMSNAAAVTPPDIDTDVAGAAVAEVITRTTPIGADT